MNYTSLVLSSLTQFKNYFINYNHFLIWNTLTCLLTIRRNYNTCRRNIDNYLYPCGYILNVMLYMLDDDDKLREYDFSKVNKHIKNELISNLYKGNEINWHQIFHFFNINKDNSTSIRFYLKLEYQLNNNIYYYVYEFDYGRNIQEKIVFPVLSNEEINKSDEMENQIIFCTLDNENYNEEIEKYMGPTYDFYGGRIPCRFLIKNGNFLSYTDLNFKEFNYSRVTNRNDYIKL